MFNKEGLRFKQAGLASEIVGIIKIETSSFVGLFDINY